MTEASPNATATKFGFPETLIASYSHWLVLARPQQPVLGATVLLCRDQAQAFSKISGQAFGELATVTADLEAALQAAFQPDKLNYLMLMMVDPDVHFHVLPRYQGPRNLAGRAYADAFWPRPVDLTQPVAPDAALTEAVRDKLKAAWRQMPR
ncbi:MAG TPA: HIT family protein [Dongiaceae bacterium]|nr:HIT family protein [Dongiaceae bacterium]